MNPLTPREGKAISVFKERLQKNWGGKISRLCLFGSRARGEGSEDSDIDVLILLKEAPYSLRGQIFEIAADLLVEYDVEISPLVMSEAHFNDLKRRERLLPREIEKDSLPL